MTIRRTKTGSTVRFGRSGKLAFGVVFVALIAIAGTVYSFMQSDTLPSDNGTATGTVLETFNGGGYTYLQLEIKGKQYWVAGPQTALEIGQTVAVSSGFLMTDFHSKALERTFDEIYFVGSIDANGATGEGESGASGSGTRLVLDDAHVGDMAQADGGLTIAAVLEKRTELSGKPVRIRAKVVKYSGEIMNTHWFHIQDGTGFAGVHDLTVTSADTVTTGSIVVVEGVLGVERDFGSGYYYPTIVESATITHE